MSSTKEKGVYRISMLKCMVSIALMVGLCCGVYGAVQASLEKETDNLQQSHNLSNVSPEAMGSIGHVLDFNVMHYVLYSETAHCLDVLGNVSETEAYLQRTFMDSGHIRAGKIIQEWMEKAGLKVHVDGVGNVRGRSSTAQEYDNGSALQQDVLLLGSHYDTVVDAGKYDGALGIVVGIAAVKALVLEQAVQHGIVSYGRVVEYVEERQRKARIVNVLDLIGGVSLSSILRRPIEVIAFSDEEGVRFQTTFLGSRAVAGTLHQGNTLHVMDREGKSVLNALQEANIARNTNDLLLAAAQKGEYAGYLEVHIEQGPVLEAAGRALGVVSGIAGQTWSTVEINGQQGHAGTVPMALRRDPVATAAAIIHQIETLCRYISLGEGELPETLNRSQTLSCKGDPSLVCTVGKISAWPGASNVIAGSVKFTLDVRSLSNEYRQKVMAAVEKLLDAECREKRKHGCKIEKNQEAAATSTDVSLTEALKQAVQRATASMGMCPAFHGDRECMARTDVSGVLSLPSGAGHDAIALADIMPVCMLFVRCKGGISHAPDESVDTSDIGLSAKATFEFLSAWQTHVKQ